MGGQCDRSDQSAGVHVRHHHIPGLHASPAAMGEEETLSQTQGGSHIPR